MTIMRDWSIDGRIASVGMRRAVERFRNIPGFVIQVVEVWRDRHRQRRELSFVCARDLRDSGAPIDTISREARKWPWQE